MQMRAASYQLDMCCRIHSWHSLRTFDNADKQMSRKQIRARSYAMNPLQRGVIWDAANVAERDMRGPVVGRKGFYGSGALWAGVVVHY
jgi:hypothetical protein